VINIYLLIATLSNCGNILKFQLPNIDGNILCGRGNDLGYGKNVENVTMDNPQPSPKVFYLYIYLKYYGCSSETRRWWGYIFL